MSEHTNLNGSDRKPPICIDWGTDTLLNNSAGPVRDAIAAGGLEAAVDWRVTLPGIVVTRLSCRVPYCEAACRIASSGEEGRRVVVVTSVDTPSGDIDFGSCRRTQL